jgi:hypothetical protein
VKVLEEIAAQASASKLEFLIVGGHAVIAHGYSRNTFDLDLLIRRNEQEGWCGLLQKLGYQQVRQGIAFIQFSSERQSCMPLDLMLVNDQTFSQMLKSAVPVQSLEFRIHTVSLPHLLALKCHAVTYGHAGRVVKDVDDVINLVAINRVNLDDPEIRSIFEKHGTPELYERVRRATRTD